VIYDLHAFAEAMSGELLMNRLVPDPEND